MGLNELEETGMVVEDSKCTKKKVRAGTCRMNLIYIMHDLHTQLTSASSGLECDSCLIVSHKDTHHI